MSTSGDFPEVLIESEIFDVFGKLITGNKGGRSQCTDPFAV